MKTPSVRSLLPDARATVRASQVWGLLLLACGMVIFSPAASAANGPPNLMTYQGYLIDNNQKPLGLPTPANYPVVFRIYDESDGGTRLWSEQQVVTVDNGNFSVILGEGTPVAGEANPTTLAGAFVGNSADRRFLGLTVTLGGNPVVIQPRLRLLPAPYSFLASQALSVDGAGVTSGTVPDSRLSSNVALRSGGNTLVGDQTVNGNLRVNALTKIGFSSTIEFGADTAGKQADAGKIGYQTFSSGLDIVGAGTSGTDRRIQFWAESEATFTGPIKAAGTVTAPAFAGDGVIPVGGIIMWGGTIAAIPPGWALCNGQTVNGNVTPDLRDRFIVGAGASYPVANTGGAAQVTMSEAQMPPHSHSYKDGFFSERLSDDPNYQKVPPNGGWDDYPFSPFFIGSHSTDDDNNRIWWRILNTNPAGSGQPQENRPPWYSLAYIMRVR